LAKLAPTSLLSAYSAGSNVFAKAEAMQKTLKLYDVLNTAVQVAYAFEGGFFAVKGLASFNRINTAVRLAESGEGMFGVGSLTHSEAMVAGRKFVGDGYRVSSRDANIWISKDGLRQFRAPTYKPKLQINQANFQSRSANKGNWTNNGHADIK
jgi:hypothetical protein